MKLMQIAIAIDQLANTLLGGYSDETLSARSYRTNSKTQKYINALFFDRDHCRKSFMAEIERKQLPPAYRKEQ
jgi:hypothetical protein